MSMTMWEYREWYESQWTLETTAIVLGLIILIMLIYTWWENRRNP